MTKPLSFNYADYVRVCKERDALYELIRKDGKELCSDCRHGSKCFRKDGKLFYCKGCKIDYCRCATCYDGDWTGFEVWTDDRA